MMLELINYLQLSWKKLEVVEMTMTTTISKVEEEVVVVGARVEVEVQVALI